MQKTRSLAVALLSVAAFPPIALADDAALRRCRGIVDSGARLACYDALPLAPAAPLAPGAVAPRQPPAPGAAGPRQSQGAAAAAAPAPAQRFGLEHKAARPADDLEKIESHIPGHFGGWRPNMRIRLANGQVWQVIDEGSRFMSVDNPRVVVRRGALGAFFLDFEGDNRSPRVRRVE